ncbi:hypothetical protein GJ744_000249 [Endocarpon pusillum]|uniref:1,3-beta-glucanosyltransferase n=1 Tax=Endocarpon pusillum TaxID=364733 RepID=A0A8H7E826_9EURO|nr:hypothetical protein GJ744_000249 [Endocarpon pusillum]
MKASNTITTTLAATALLASSALAQLDPIVIKGSKFFYKTNGTQFFIKGVAYQQDIQGGGNSSTSTNSSYHDPLTDGAACRRDIPLLQELQTNTIRVYAINPDQDHTECMKLLSDAGIYVIADLSEPKTSINRASPRWDSQLYDRYTSVVDLMSQYTNTLGFFAGNEVSNEASNTNASAFVKAAVRDMKKYIKDRNYRPMGVGYATNDDAEIRSDMEAYFNCGPAEESIDFWGYNIYSWCGDSSYQESGYDQRTREFSSYTVPVFFAEYGCNQVQPRQFTEVGALYGDQMTPVWSGGIVYMYFQEANNYGLVSVDGNDVSKLADFTALSSQIAAVTPSGVNRDQYTPTNTVPSSCPTVGSAWQAASALPPTPDSALCDCMAHAVTCTVAQSVSDEEIGDLFGIVCGLPGNPCAGVSASPSNGTYGAYGMCEGRQQLAFALDTYDRHQKEAGNQDGCNFSGSATRQSAVATGTCSSRIQAVGDGTSATPTSGSSGSSSSSTSRGAAAGGVAQASFNIGSVPLGIYAICAILSGAGMVLL